MDLDRYAARQAAAADPRRIAAWYVVYVLLNTVWVTAMLALLRSGDTWAGIAAALVMVVGALVPLPVLIVLHRIAVARLQLATRSATGR